MKRALALALTLWCGAAIIPPARGQTAGSDYPQRAVAFLCPFPAGGGTDILTRMLAQELQEKLARPVIVDNRPGAGTIVAAQAAARAAPRRAYDFARAGHDARHGSERSQVRAL